MEADGHESKSVDILHPEILSKEDLVALLAERYIRVDPECSNKDDLIELFHRTVTPLHQREPRANRRGRTINKARQKLEARRRLKGDSAGYEGSKVMLNIGSLNSSRNHLKGGQAASTSSSTFSASSPGTCRLKPPPIVSSKQRTIKLNSSATATTSSTKPKADSAGGADNVGSNPKKVTTTKTLVQVKSSEPAADAQKSPTGPNSEPSIAKKMRKISLKPSVLSTKIGIKRTVPVDVNGKTTTTSSEETSKKVASSSSEEESSPKKKIKRIAWP